MELQRCDLENRRTQINYQRRLKQRFYRNENNRTKSRENTDRAKRDDAENIKLYRIVILLNWLV